jgi:hypothetical protein
VVGWYQQGHVDESDFVQLVESENYTLSTCSGIIATSGRRGRGFVVDSVHRDIHLSLPTLIECDHIPDNRDEIPTPQGAAVKVGVKTNKV